MKWLSPEEVTIDGVYAYRDIDQHIFGILYFRDGKWKARLDTAGSNPIYIDTPPFQDTGINLEFIRMDKPHKKKKLNKQQIIDVILEACDINDPDFKFGLCHNCEELRFQTTHGIPMCPACQEEHIWSISDEYVEELESDYEPGDKYLLAAMEQKEIYDQVQLAIKKYRRTHKKGK